MAEVKYGPAGHWKGAPMQAFQDGGEPPDNGGMDARVAKLEQFAQETRDRLARIETRMDTFSTREDLHKEIGVQTWRIVGAMLTFGALLSGAVFWIARSVH